MLQSEMSSEGCDLRPLSPRYIKAEESSILLKVLPYSVQSWIPRVPSMRRSVSAYNSSFAHNRQASATASGAATPPPRYSATIDRNHGSEDTAFSTDAEDVEHFHGCIRSVRSLSNSSSHSALAHETASGIGWKYASQGVLRPSLPWILSTLIENRP